MARASVFETIQIGVESTSGTQVSAGKRLQSFEMDCDPVIPIEMVESMGWKSPVDNIVQKEHTRASIKGILAYNDILYLLSSALCTATISTPSANGVFTATITGSPTGGTFTLTFEGQTTATIAYNAAAAAVQSALEALSTIGTGNVTVTGSAGGPYTITLAVALLGNQSVMTGSGAGLTGGTDPALGVTTTAASSTRRWRFLPSVTGPDTYKTFTVEKGSSAGASSFTYGIVTDIDLDFAMGGCDVKAEMLGQELSDGITMTSTPTDVAIAAVAPNTLDVYLGSTLLGMTKLTDCYKASWSVKDRHKPVFTLNSAEPSFSETVETKFSMAAQLVIEQDSVANAFMTDLRARTTKYCRIMATGGSIESGYIYRIRITFPFKFREPKRGDNDGVYAGTYDLIPIYNSTFGGVVDVTVDTTLTAL